MREALCRKAGRFFCATLFPKTLEHSLDDCLRREPCALPQMCLRICLEIGVRSRDWDKRRPLGQRHQIFCQGAAKAADARMLLDRDPEMGAQELIQKCCIERLYRRKLGKSAGDALRSKRLLCVCCRSAEASL